jgi:hypothetical protein
MEDIRTFLGYIQDREKKLGKYEAFCFSKYKDKTGFHNAAYPNSAAIPLAETRQSSPPIADELGGTFGLGTQAEYSRHVIQHRKSTQSRSFERASGNPRRIGPDAAKPSDPLSLTNLNCLPVEVFTLPRVFLVNLRGITRNPCGSVRIPSRDWKLILLVFQPFQPTWSLSKYYMDTRTVLGQFRVDIYLHRLGRIRLVISVTTVTPLFDGSHDPQPLP